MGDSLGSRFKKAWNIFLNRDPTAYYRGEGVSYSYRPDRIRFSRGNERSIATSVYNKIAIDVASVDIKHCRLDANGRYVAEINSGLNNCLTLEANIDQNSRAFIQDVVMSMFDEGSVAIVPVDTDIDPRFAESYKIFSMRTAKITQWYPDDVEVELYDDRTGQKKNNFVSGIRCLGN